MIKFLRYVLSLTIALRYLQDNFLGPEVDDLLYFMIKLLNSFSENGIYFITGLFRISSNKSRLIWWFCAKLNNECKACYKSLSSRYGWPLHWIALIAESLYILIQFMSFQGLQFFAAISWILVLKKTCLVFLTMLLKFFQFLTCFETLYLSSSLWYFLFYYDFECFVILTIFKYLNQILSANSCTVHSRVSLLEMCFMFSLLTASMSSAMKFFLLFLTIICFLVWIYSLIIAISTLSGVWSNKSLYSGYMSYAGPPVRK